MAILSNNELVDLFIGLRPRIERVIVGRVGCRQAAADLLQDMFFRISRAPDTLENQDEARRYLLRMARNAATDHFRVKVRQSRLLEGLAPLCEDVENGPEDAVINGDQMRVIDAALNELPPKARDVLILSRVEGLTHAEIAARLGVSESLVQKYIVRALQTCQLRLNQKAPR
jgi:RNA polymerase sigma factor (sigma-70 family)